MGHFHGANFGKIGEIVMRKETPREYLDYLTTEIGPQSLFDLRIALKSHLYHAGKRGYLDKPYTEQECVRIVDEWIKEKKGGHS
jgi:hypothetical protein